MVADFVTFKLNLYFFEYIQILILDGKWVNNNNINNFEKNLNKIH
jgi:hypothetical protein